MTDTSNARMGEIREIVKRWGVQPWGGVIRDLLAKVAELETSENDDGLVVCQRCGWRCGMCNSVRRPDDER